MRHANPLEISRQRIFNVSTDPEQMRKPLSLIRDAVFFTGYYLYGWKVIKPELYCQFNEPVFSFDRRYLSEFLNYPGGVLRLISDFFSQFYLLPCIGALIITGIAAAITLMTRKISDSVLKGRSAPIFDLFPVIFLLVLHNQFFHNLTVDIGILFALSVFYLHIATSFNKRLPRIAVALLSSAWLYYAAGGYLLLFASLCGVHEIVIRRRPMDALLYAGIAVILPYFGAKALFLVELKNSYFFLLPFDAGYKPVITPYVLFLYYHAMMFAPAPGRLIQKPIRKINPRVQVVLLNGFLFVFAVLFVMMTRDPKIQTMLQIDRCSRRGQYQDVIRLAGQDSSGHLLVTLHANRALFHAGRLLDDMFSFPQKWWVNGLILSSKEAYEMPLRNSDVWFDLGHVNEAQHWAHEALAITGTTPWNCQRLADIYILKDNPAAADKCLILLEKTLFFRNWAKRNRKFLDVGQPVSGVGRLDEIKSRMVAKDFIVHPDFPERDLEFIVDQNPANKMAFEYLIAHYLLMGLPDRIVDRIDNLRILHYARFPRHFEEALILHQVLNKMKPVNLAGYQFSRETVFRFRDFQKSLKRYQDNPGMDRSELKRSFGDTYWYYYLFENPLKRQ
jgi:hypothetical protein